MNIPFCVDVPAETLSTYRGGGKVKYVVYPSNQSEIKEVIAFATSEGIPFFILGNGSNLLVKDGGYNGIAISLKNLNGVSVNGNEITVGAGVNIAKVFNVAFASGLSGLERLVGIPATVGGAIKGNAGAFGAEIGDLVTSVEVLTCDGKPKTLPNESLQFGYRSSNIDGVITSVTFSLRSEKRERIYEIYGETKEKRRLSQPNESSLGSVYLRDGDIIPAKLIDAVGLKGFSIGGAMVSTKHANFIVNTGLGTATDYLRVCDKIEASVLREFGINLKKEITII